MKHPLEQLLDGCIDELNSGIDLEAVLAAYPEAADELRPLLATAITAQVTVPPPVRKAEGKALLMARAAAQRRLVETAEGYVVELRAGVPVDELLARAPAALRPLVWAAARMHDTPPPVPSPERRAAGKEAVMALAARRRAAHLAADAPPWLARARLALAAATAGRGPRFMRYRRVWSGALGTSLAVLVLFVGASGVGSASASSLPGEPFYHVKRLGESAQLFFAFEPARRAELNLEFTERRLREMQRLMETDREVPIVVVEDWLRSQSSAWTHIQELPAAQRTALLGLLVDLVGDGAAFESRLHRLVSDQAALDALLQQSAGLVRTVRGAQPPRLVTPELPLVIDPTPVRVRPADTEPEEPQRALPPVVAPVPAPVVDPAASAPAEPPLVAPPAEEPEDERDGPVGGQPAAGQPPVGQPPLVEPSASPAPPPIVVPPLEDPNTPPGGGLGGDTPTP